MTLEMLDEQGKYQAAEVPDAVRAIVILNVPGFSGGRSLWQHDKQARCLCLFLTISVAGGRHCP